MAIIVDNDTRLVVQGLTGREGSFHAGRNRSYGTNLVAGVTPGKGGTTHEGTPVFDTVADAVDATGANTSMIFVPARFATDAIYEAVDAGIQTVICIAEGLPAHEMLRVYNYIRPKGITLIGPNCPGVLSPGKANVGIIPAEIFTAGKVGLVSRSGTLTYEAVAQLTEIGLGQSSAVGIGGDPINGLKHIDIMKAFNDDPDTDAVIMIGEIGGPDEAEAARWCKLNMKKPIVGFIAGVTAPAGKRMGHAGALISGGADTADAKLAVMEECGFTVTRNPSEMAKLLKALL